MKKTIVVRNSDVSGKEGAEELLFGLDGTDYAIDLTVDEAKPIRESLAIIATKARIIKRPGTRASAQRTTEDPGLIRAWAVENSISVNLRGRIPGPLAEFYKTKDVAGALTQYGHAAE